MSKVGRRSPDGARGLISQTPIQTSGGWRMMGSPSTAARRPRRNCSFAAGRRHCQSHLSPYRWNAAMAANVKRRQEEAVPPAQPRFLLHATLLVLIHYLGGCHMANYCLLSLSALSPPGYLSRSPFRLILGSRHPRPQFPASLA